ncbi:MAG: siderophore-interacting protein [Archangium sp.]|nr:siderophore-interacting protein [Archangium sp.]
MASLTEQVRATVGGWICSEGTAAEVTTLSPAFVRVRVESPALRGTSVGAGDKVQVLVAESYMRTFTPIDVDPQRGAMTLLAFIHGEEPASRWGRALSVGQRVLFFGPRGSLSLESARGPLVVFGDETSVALAASVKSRAKTVLEVTTPADVAPALQAFDIEATVVARQPGDAHFRALETALRSAVTPDTTVAFSGRAATIQAMRRALRETSTPHAKQLVKAYWAEGKRGID